MRAICFYFQVHQPHRLRTYRFFDIGNRHDYYDDYQNRYIVRRVADKCYLPANELLGELIGKFNGDFRIAYSISGIALEQFERYAPEVLESFRKLAQTGHVEFLSETYAHSLAALRSESEFKRQVALHREKIRDLIGVDTTAFRNTELIYSDKIGEMVASMGFKTMLTEGARHILGWKSPNYVYTNNLDPRLRLLLKNFKLSDDIAFRFSQQSWPGWPLTVERYTEWLKGIDENEEVINLFMDYETFGEHQWPETGIFEFLKHLPGHVLQNTSFKFMTPTQVTENMQPVSAINVPYPISWADEERDLTAWLGNELQDEAFDKLYSLEEKVKNCNNDMLKYDWMSLQTSDHFYYMCTKWFSDGDVHKYFNPYGSPYDAFINFMNVLSDFMIRLDEHCEGAKAVTKPAKRVRPARRAKREKLSINKLSDLEHIPKTYLKRMLRFMETATLAYALHGMDKKLKDFILSHLGKKDLMYFEAFQLRNPSPSDVEAARAKLLQLVKENY